MTEPELSKIESTTRSVSTAERLRMAILDGQFAPGEQLREALLSKKLEVSRTPIRAALQSLAGEGLIKHIPNCGYFVRSFSLDDIVQAYEIRAVLEGLAAKRAAQMGMDYAVSEQVQEALNRGDELLARGNLVAADRGVYGEINDIFHSAIQTTAGSTMLKDMLRIAHQVAPSAHRNVIAFEYKDVRRRHDDHHRIFEAILLRDAGRAEMLMRDHVESIKIALIRALPSSYS